MYITLFALIVELLFVNISYISKPSLTYELLESAISDGERYIVSNQNDSLHIVAQYLALWPIDSEKEEAFAFSNLLMGHYHRKSYVDSTLIYAHNALEYYQNHKDIRKTTICYNTISSAQANKGLIEEAYQTLMTAIAQYLNLDPKDLTKEDLWDLGKIHYNMGFNRINLGDLESGANHFDKAKVYGTKLNNKYLLANVYNQFGNISILRSNFRDAINYNLEALTYVEEKNERIKYYMYAGLGTAYGELNILDSARYYNTQVLEYRRKGNNAKSIAITLLNLSDIDKQEGKCEESNRKNEEVYEITKKLGLNEQQLASLVNLCDCTIQLGKPHNALQYAKEGIAIAEENIHYKTASEVYWCAYKASEKLGLYHQGLEYHILHKQYADSLINQQSERALQEFEVKLDLSAKEANIKSLHEEAKVSQLRYKSKILYMLLGTIGIGAISLGLYFKSRRKALKEEKRRLEIEQKLLRLQMNPHFIFNVISTIQNYLFDQPDLKIALTYLSKFAVLMRQTLENSRESYITIKEEIDSLENYLSLQQLRYENKFDYKISIPDDIDPYSILIPPLMLQPFVENAIEHGKIHQVKNGIINIRIDNSNNEMKLVISDNGLGVTQHQKVKLQLLNKKTSLASKITNERLEILSRQHRKKFKLLIENLQIGGTKVTINLPLITS